MSEERGTNDDEADESLSRFVVGIDLGTTNCAVAFVDCEAIDRGVQIFQVDQFTDWGQTERRSTLPSFHYQCTEEERGAAQQGLPWEDAAPAAIVGTLARDAGLAQPGRRIASAKSWLSHDGVDRTADLLPWHGDADVSRMSPVATSAEYLKHIRLAWDHRFPDVPLSEQEVVITLPASFDEVARELTVRAAKLAGLPRVYLIEEPQAAFYAWIDHHRDQWEDLATPGQTILVCDIGGGTSDFTLIRVRPAERGESAESDENQAPATPVQFHRVAVGNHLILGGDNLDLALAKFAEAKFSENGPLGGRDWERLIQVCRDAKETLLGEERPESYTLTLAGEGSRLIGGARSIELTAEDIDACLVDGFFPTVRRDDFPSHGASGFREFGLPYAADPAITKHLAEFLSTHQFAGLTAEEIEVAKAEESSAGRPDLVLFNGGVMNAARLQQRVVDSIAAWFGEDENDAWQPHVLQANRLDLAVAHGAAYYGLVRRGHGVRIAANLGRSYYMQVAENPPEAMCLIPGSAEAGQTFAADHALELQIGTPVQFPLWATSTRLSDQVGDLTPIDHAEMSPLPPIRTVLTRGKDKKEQQITVRIETELSEIGTLGLYCVDAQTSRRWKLDFDIRSTLETDVAEYDADGERRGIVDSDTLDACQRVLSECFSPQRAERAGANAPGLAPGKVMRRLRSASDMDRSSWPPTLLRSMWQMLMELEAGRRKSPAHEARWLNLLGYCLRPGYGVAVDDWRVSEVWRRVHGKLAFGAAASRTESLILWRRIAGGLTGGQQAQLVAPLMAVLGGKSGALESHEAAELWRLAGALESIDPTTKRSLAELALRDMSRRRTEPYRDAMLWAVGRLASRRPVYGPLNTVVASSFAETLANELMQQTSDLAARQLAIMQITQKTGDRLLDVSENFRQTTLDWLRETESAPSYLARVSAAGNFEAADQSAIFGESLPLGIQLVR